MLEEFYKMFYLGYSEQESSEGIDYVLTEKLNKERERIAKSDIVLMSKLFNGGSVTLNDGEEVEQKITVELS